MANQNELVAALKDAVDTLEFFVGKSNCIPEAARNSGKTEEELWTWLQTARDNALKFGAHSLEYKPEAE
jgi:hypothetical protein